MSSPRPEAPRPEALRPKAPGRARFRAFQPLDTRWRDNDAFGHVNNAVYYSYMDTALTAWLAEAGLLQSAGGEHVFVVAENGCRFHRELAFPDRLEVGLVLRHLGRSAVRWEMGVFRAGEDQAAASGFFVHVHVEREGRRPVPIPPATRATMATMLDADGTEGS